MKYVLKLSLAAVAVAILAGCATKPTSAPSSATVASSSTNTTATATGSSTSPLSPAQQLQQTLAALPSTVYFDFNQYSLSANAIAALQQNAAVLLSNPQVNVMLAGNTDPIGSQEYNFHLGMKRAQAVSTYLKSQGVPASQLCTVSYGELKSSGEVDQTALSAAKGKMAALIVAYAPDRRTDISYNQTCQGANSTGMANSGS